MKKLFAFVLIVALAVGFWFAFAFWTGLYSVYTFPPTKTDPDGKTLIISRDQDEPMFNSPAVKPPAPKKVESRGIGFGGGAPKGRPFGLRTIVELPYIEWAYEKSIEDSKAAEKPKK
jgi:hypothetical protein